MDTVVACMEKTRANTLPMRACLEACIDARPYREVEDDLAGQAIFHRSNQTPHILIGLLVKAGGIERIDVAETESGAEEAQFVARAGKTQKDLSQTDESQRTEIDRNCAAQEESETKLPDQPIDYLLKTTEAGCAALDFFDQDVMLLNLLESEPEEFCSAYFKVLACCKGGASRSSIKAAIGAVKVETSSTMTDDKKKSVYPEYFISKLETVGALLWDGEWLTTDSGLRALAAHEES